MTIYFGYARVSKTDYEDSIENQEDFIRKLAKTKLSPNDELIIIKEESSAKNGKERVEFNKMIKILYDDRKNAGKEINKRKYGGILFYKLDRLIRSMDAMSKLVDLFESGYELISCTETIENTSTGKLLFRILASFAIYENEKLSSRQAVAQIYNILNKRFKSLGGSSLIFGYSMKDDNIVKNDIEALIINRIFEIYLQNNFTYREIFDEVIKEKKFKLYLDKYFQGKRGKDTDNEKSSKKNPLTDKTNFIKNILTNNNQYGYNGIFSRNLRLTDETILKYLNSSDTNDIFKIKGDIYTGSKVNITIFLEELNIVPLLTYEAVQEKLSNNRKKYKFEKDEYEQDLFFEGILYFNVEGKKILTKGYKNKNKKTFHYRILKPKCEKSQNIIEDAILKSGLTDKILGISDEQIGSIYSLILEVTKEDNSKERRSLIGNINFCRSYIKMNKEALQETSDKKEIEAISNILADREKSLKNFQAQLDELDSEGTEILTKYIDLFRLKNLRKKGVLMRKSFYQSFFDRIVYNPEEQKIKIKIFSFISKFIGIDEIEIDI